MKTKRGRTIAVIAAVLIGGVIVLNLLARGLDRAVGGNEPGGVTDSSYATGADGLGAYASLLTAYDHAVSQQRGPLLTAPLPPDATLVVLEPSTVLSDDDTATLLDFVTNGGRLVIGGRQPSYVNRLRDHAPEWTATGRSPWIAIGGALTGVREVNTAAEGSWRDPGSTTVVVGDHDRSLLTTEHVGQGDIFFLADPSALQNQYLGEADNAAFGLALAGPTDRPVVFAEGVHGFGETRGIAAIPTRWKWALLILALAAIAFVWSRARRFGPPDRAARELPPARAEYVRSLSTTLERTHNPPAALAPVQRWTRDRITARAALRPDAPDEEIARAAKELGCSDEEVHALFAPPTNDNEALALGRVVARVSNNDGRID